MTKKQEPGSVKVRRRYRLEDGTAVPGVTTVTGLLSKKQWSMLNSTSPTKSVVPSQTLF